MAQSFSVAWKYQRANNAPEHTSFSDQHAHERTNGHKCIYYLNNVALDMKMITTSYWK